MDCSGAEVSLLDCPGAAESLGRIPADDDDDDEDRDVVGVMCGGKEVSIVISVIHIPFLSIVCFSPF